MKCLKNSVKGKNTSIIIKKTMRHEQRFRTLGSGGFRSSKFALSPPEAKPMLTAGHFFHYNECLSMNRKVNAKYKRK